MPSSRAEAVAETVGKARRALQITPAASTRSRKCDAAPWSSLTDRFRVSGCPYWSMCAMAFVTPATILIEIIRSEYSLPSLLRWRQPGLLPLPIQRARQTSDLHARFLIPRESESGTGVPLLPMNQECLHRIACRRYCTLESKAMLNALDKSARRST